MTATAVLKVHIQKNDGVVITKIAQEKTYNKKIHCD